MVTAYGAMLVVALVAVAMLAGTAAQVVNPVNVQATSVKNVNDCAFTLNVTLSADELAGTLTPAPPTTSILKTKESKDLYLNVLLVAAFTANTGRATFTLYRPIRNRPGVFQRDVYVEKGSLSSIVAAASGTVTVTVSDGCPVSPGLYLEVTSSVAPALNSNICVPRSSTTEGPGPA